ncbi:MAG TPA: hypothetical protein VK601_26670 [Kofleriaceae bacterium]|nr:hypothetical protein [Kofleriaceae bacterium]
MRLIGVLLVVVGCHAGSANTPDAAIDADAPPQPVGMFVTWSAKPALPGPVTDKITVTEATFHLEHLQLISDAGADDRTTRSRYQIAWDAAGVPAQEMFPEAPAAVYQRILLDMRAAGQPSYSYEIRGTWRDSDNVAMPFRIIDRLMLEIPISCSVALAAGSSMVLGIRVDLKDALNSVNWKDADDDDGVLVPTPQQLFMLHGRLEDAFDLDDG